MRDPYEILGVKKSAAMADIKAAYRKLAKEYHPDINPGDPIVEQRFKEITQAYHLLSDKTQRARYDAGEIGPDGQPKAEHAFRRGGGGFGGGFSDDFFADIFGQQRNQGRTVRMKGTDVTYSVRVSFVDAVRGAKRRLRLHDGKSIEIAIPEGAEDSQILRLAGMGMPGIGGAAAGDALVELQIDAHPFFERDGRNILLTFPITLPEAVLGAKVKVPTIDGSVMMNIPAGSNSGALLRLKGKGIIDRQNQGAGDQLVRLQIMLPEKIDASLKDFISQWASNASYDVRQKFDL